MMFEAVIFDWDGTLADTKQVIVVSFQKALSEVNCIVSDEYIERRIGIGAADTFCDVLQSANIRADQKMIKHLVDRKSQLEIELTNQVKLFPGAKELLKALHGKVKMGLASMNNRSVIIHMVEANGLTQFFQAFLTAESISHSKPHPEIFIKTASELKTNPEKSVVLEDSIFGVKAAKSANMGCVAVTTGVYSKEELKEAKPDLIVKTLCDNQIVPFILN